MTTARTISPDPLRTPALGAAAMPEVPSWVLRVVRTGESVWARRTGAEPLRIIDAGQAALVSGRIPDAMELKAAALTDATRATYTAIVEQLRTLRACHPVRFWNFIPRIHDPLGETVDRYMVFNAGRYAGLCGATCRAEPVGGGPRPVVIPTATGVGHNGRDLVIHALGLAATGTPVENPRQIPAYRYSQRYGPLPPCFARATAAVLPGEDRPVLLVGGTASIVGEDSRHSGDVELQFHETCQNLQTLVGAWHPAAHADWSAFFRHVRVYAPADTAAIGDLVRRKFQPVTEVEVVRADLCRREFLVEIEAVVDGPASGRHTPLAGEA
jgi:chorismate lyase/3-hydroxybenzoate synthase